MIDSLACTRWPGDSPRGVEALGPTGHGLPRRGDVIAAKYRVEKILGSGGMGAVFEVTHVVTGKRFAVKWLLPELTSGADAIARFIREAQVAGRVEHPNIVNVYDFGRDAESFYMVMELLEGETLAQYSVRRRRLTAEDAARILLPVTRGLYAAHVAGVIHRDLKPDNIFLCCKAGGEIQPKLLDFGISKLVARARPTAPNLAITAEGAMVGTPNYMAPEQVRSEPIDARTDVYALGVILYQLLTGVLPFPAQSFNELVLKVVSATPVALAELATDAPPGLVELVERAMAREPSARFQSIAELGRALEPFARGMQFESTPLPASAELSGAIALPTRPRKSGWRSALLAILGLVALAIVAARVQVWQFAQTALLDRASRRVHVVTAAALPPPRREHAAPVLERANSAAEQPQPSAAEALAPPPPKHAAGSSGSIRLPKSASLPSASTRAESQPARSEADRDPTGAIKLPLETPAKSAIVRRAPQLNTSDFR
jgi:serine/threonine protein kinase